MLNHISLETDPLLSWLLQQIHFSNQSQQLALFPPLARIRPDCVPAKLDRGCVPRGYIRHVTESEPSAWPKVVFRVSGRTPETDIIPIYRAESGETLGSNMDWISLIGYCIASGD